MIFDKKRHLSKSKTKGQVSMEYLIVMGFIFMMIIPLVVIFMQENDNMERDIAIASASKISKELIDAAEEIYYKGPPSKTTIKVNFPKRIINVTISPTEISMKITGSKGTINNINYPSEINL